MREFQPRHINSRILIYSWNLWKHLCVVRDFRAKHSRVWTAVFTCVVVSRRALFKKAFSLAHFHKTFYEEEGKNKLTYNWRKIENPDHQSSGIFSTFAKFFGKKACDSAQKTRERDEVWKWKRKTLEKLLMPTCQTWSNLIL